MLPAQAQAAQPPKPQYKHRNTFGVWTVIGGILSIIACAVVSGMTSVVSPIHHHGGVAVIMVTMQLHSWLATAAVG
jgi:hypothetical protein